MVESTQFSLSPGNLPLHDHALSWTELALHHVHEHGGDVFYVDGSSIVWEEKARDFDILHEIDELLRLNIYTSSKEIIHLLPMIRKLLLRTRLFSELLKPSLILSKAHREETTIDHILNVWRISTEFDFSHNNNASKRRANLWEALGHDTGKVFGASGKESRFHPFLSSILIQDFFDQLPDLESSTIEAMLHVIRYHHSFEELAKKRIDLTEFIDRFSDKSVFHDLFMPLSIADVQSTPSYAHFAHQHLAWGKFVYPKLLELQSPRSTI